MQYPGQSEGERYGRTKRQRSLSQAKTMAHRPEDARDGMALSRRSGEDMLTLLLDCRTAEGSNLKASDQFAAVFGADDQQRVTTNMVIDMLRLIAED